MKAIRSLTYAGLVLGGLVMTAGPAIASEKIKVQKPIRVSVTYTMVLKAGSDDPDELAALSRKARRTFYQRAKDECEDLLELIARSCQLMNLNIRSGRYGRPNQGPGVSLTGTAQFAIQAK